MGARQLAALVWSPGIMQITIKHIDSVTSISVPGTAQLGYIAKFENNTVSGYATIVPSAGASGTLVAGRKINVDIKQDYISRFRSQEDSKWSIEPGENRGDYNVQGRVICNYDTGEFCIQAGDFIFTLTADDTLGQLPDVDDWVSFDLHGLSLWDRNVS